MDGPGPDDVRHIRRGGDVVALCGYEVAELPPAVDEVPGRREQRMRDCAACWEVWRGMVMPDQEVSDVST